MLQGDRLRYLPHFSHFYGRQQTGACISVVSARSQRGLANLYDGYPIFWYANPEEAAA